MEQTLTIFEGTDIRLPGTLTSADNSPIDLTGATVSLIAGSLSGATVTVTNAAAGQIVIAAEWSATWPEGRQSFLQVNVTTAGGESTTFPKLWVKIQ